MVEIVFTKEGWIRRRAVRKNSFIKNLFKVLNEKIKIYDNKKKKPLTIYLQ